MFTSVQVLPGIHQITDCMGVCFTLFTGEKRALLVDAGYGLEDVYAYVRTLTELPLTVILTHCHHDHALGARWFSDTCLFPQDLPHFPVYTGERQRRRVMEQAAAKGLQCPEDYLTAPIRQPVPLQEGVMDLGGLQVQVLHCPGHTPGSCMIYVPQHSLLLTADNWNCCTWLFFPEALPLKDYLRNMTEVFDCLEFTHVLCSHQPGLFPREVPEKLFKALREGDLERDYPVPLWP